MNLAISFTGEVATDKITHEVYEEVDKLEMPHFFKECGNQLMRDLDIGNCVCTLMVAFLHEDNDLMEAAADFILANKTIQIEETLEQKLVGEFSPLVFYLLRKSCA